MDISGLLQGIGILFTLAVSIWTLIESKKDSQTKAITDTMVQKRSLRIEFLRKYSSEIISYSKSIIIIDPDKTLYYKEKLIYSVSRFVSLLQYQYPHDVELIDKAREIENLFALTNNYSSAKDSYEILREFWSICDIYIGTEHERLKKESLGNLPESGAVEAETSEFEDIYKKIASKTHTSK